MVTIVYNSLSIYRGFPHFLHRQILWGVSIPVWVKLLSLSCSSGLVCPARYLLREFPLPAKHHRIIPRTVRKKFLAHEASPFCPNLGTGSTLWLVVRSSTSHSAIDLARYLPSRGRSALSFTVNDYDTISTRCKLNYFQTDSLPTTASSANPPRWYSILARIVD